MGGGPRGVLALHPAALVSILGVPKNFSLIVGKIYRWICLEQWTEV